MLNMTRKRGGVRATLPLVPNTRAGCRSSRRGAAQAGDRLRLVAWPDNDELSMDNMIGTISFILARFDDATRRLPFRSPRALRCRLYLYPLGELEDIEISVDIQRSAGNFIQRWEKLSKVILNGSSGNLEDLELKSSLFQSDSHLPFMLTLMIPVDYVLCGN